jgi:hypothetical protein
MVVPKFAEFELSGLSTTAEQLLAMLACSKRSLTQLSLRSITLAEGSTWNELLSMIAKDFTSLTSFNIIGLSQPGLGRIDFHKAPDHIPQEFKAGLRFRGKAPEKRVMGMSYDGPDAAMLLSVLGSHAYLQTWGQIEERRAKAIAKSSETVSTA